MRIILEVPIEITVARSVSTGDGTIIDIDDKIKKAKSILKYKKAVDNLIKEQDNLKILNKKLDSLHIIIQTITNTENKLRDKEQLLSKTKKTFKKEMLRVCPLCEQVIKV